MKRCPQCNRAYSDMVKVCSACGTDLSGNPAPTRSQPIQNHTAVEQKQETRVVQAQVVQKPVQNTSADDSGSFLWVVPGLFIPLVGWILYFVWKDKKPKNAKMANIGAWVGFISGMVMTMAGM